MSKLSVALAILQQLPSIIQFAENLFPTGGQGVNKKLTVTSKMSQYEGAVALDQSVRDARSALIDAQVAYANAMATATETAQSLGIPVAPPVIVPPLVEQPPNGGGAVIPPIVAAAASSQTAALTPATIRQATAQPLSTARSIRTPAS